MNPRTPYSPPDTPTINGQAIPIVGVKQEVGHLGPPVLDGRFVQSADEIALGSRTLRQLHAHVGRVLICCLDDCFNRLSNERLLYFTLALVKF